ncbi:MAG: F0F1 ATP synthase subunit A [candidate division Zixibacteria bacterium]|nr:F0F1 ATP synthase subunit A [candidate division Zixibacteria bacterium]
MNISPDEIIILQIGEFTLSATIVFTWLVMAILVILSWLATRKIKIEGDISGLQNMLESIVSYIRDEIGEVIPRQSDRYLPFLGTLFLFISLSNLLAIVPGYHPPTGSLYTTVALASCVFFAVPLFGVVERGLSGYLKNYVKPTPFMLPFNIIGEISRTLALAVRLFGNVMSGTLIIGVLLSIAPFFVPVIMKLLELLIGQIHAYIFAVLALVYIASAVRAHEEEEKEINNIEEDNDE